METFKELAEFLLNPFFLCILLLVFMLVSWKKLASFRLYLLSFILLITLMALSTGYLPSYLTAHLESKYPVVVKVNPSVKWVVVLGGGQRAASGMPANQLLTSASLKRLIEGMRLIHELPNARLILSGGVTSKDESEASLMFQTTQLLAISKNNMVLESRSLNTEEQAENIKKIIGTQPFYLVTSAVHMPRSMDLFEKYGLNPIAAPTDYTLFWSTSSWIKTLIPNAYNLSYFTIAFHEILGRAWAFGLRGN